MKKINKEKEKNRKPKKSKLVLKKKKTIKILEPKLPEFSSSISHVWSVLCRSSVTDSQTNNISLSNVIERLTLEKPATDLTQITPQIIEKEIIVGIPLEIVSLWRRGEKGENLNADVSVDIFGPSGEILGTFPYHFEMKNEHRRIRTRLIFKSIKVRGGGEHFLVVKIKEVGESEFRPVAHIPLEIVVKQ